MKFSNMILGKSISELKLEIVNEIVQNHVNKKNDEIIDEFIF